ncbi:MAG: terpene synthase family protein, partial [Natronosporangium sp.]
PPTAERYLAVAARTVNYHSFGYALLLAGPDPPANATVDRLEPALWDAACAVRLGNDLASVRRDRAARALNVLDLRVRDGGPVTTRRSVRRRIARHARAHDQHLSSLTTPELAGPARSLTRCLRVSIGLYRHSDLR